MPAVIYIDWTSSDVTCADLSITIYDLTTSDLIYSSKASALAQEFIYTLGSALNDGTYYNVGVDITTGSALLNGDSSSARVFIKEITVHEANEYGCLNVDTSFFVELSMVDGSSPDTTFYVDITREDFAEDGAGGIFFNAYDITGIEVDVSNVENSYDYETRSNYAEFYHTTTRQLSIYRDTTFVTGGAGALLVVDFSPGGFWYDASVGVYIGTGVNDFSSSVNIGTISDKDFVSGVATKEFSIPEVTMQAFVNQNFLNTCCHFMWGTKGTEAVLYIYDVRLVFDKGYDGIALDTSCSTAVYDTTELVESSYIDVTNVVRLHSGDSYVFDYYTPGSFVNLGINNSYTYEVWNEIELWLQTIGRYFNSPLTFETNVPEHVDIVLHVDATGAVSVASAYKDNTHDLELDMTRLKISVGESGKSFTMPSVHVSPRVVIRDATAYAIVSEYDGTSFNLSFYNTDTSEFVDVESEGIPVGYATTITLLGLGRRYYGR